MRFSLEGIILIAIGFFLFFFYNRSTHFYIQSLSFIMVILGLFFFFMGKEFFKELAFPVLFLIFMIPIPSHIYMAMAEFVRDITLGVSAWTLSQTTVPFLREGFLVHLPNITLSINIGCSGIRYLISYFVFGIAYAYIFKTGLIERILLVSLTIPISLLASVMRLMSIFLGAYYIGAFMAGHRPHILISWCVFFIVLMGAIFLDRFIANRGILRKEKKGITRISTEGGTYADRL